MRIDEQLREMARHADQHQRAITAAEVMQRASGQDRPPLEAPTRLDKATAADTDDREGDIIMLDTEDRPTGPVAPSRGSPGRWLLVAAAVAVVAVVGAVLVVAGGDDKDPVDTATAPTTATAPPPAQDVMALPGQEDFVELETGSYFIDPDGDDTTPMRVTYQVAAEGWSAWIGAVKFTDLGVTTLSITTVTNLVTDACLDHTPREPAVGPTVDDLATALTQLTPFEVSAPPTDVTLLGYPGKHLELTVPDQELADCLNDELHSWISPIGGPFSAYRVPGQTEEFWILDVDGTRLVLQTLDSPASPPEEVAERDAIFDSIRIEP